MGRPKKEIKNEYKVAIYLTKEEKELVKAITTLKKLPMSIYIKQLVLEDIKGN